MAKNKSTPRRSSRGIQHIQTTNGFLYCDKSSWGPSTSKIMGINDTFVISEGEEIRYRKGMCRACVEENNRIWKDELKDWVRLRDFHRYAARRLAEGDACPTEILKLLTEATKQRDTALACCKSSTE